MTSRPVQVPVDAGMGRVPRTDVPVEHAAGGANGVRPAAARDAAAGRPGELLEVFGLIHGAASTVALAKSTVGEGRMKPSVVWAKVRGATSQALFHAWFDGSGRCSATRRAREAGRFRRSLQPVKACRECLRIIDGGPMWPNSSHRGQTLRRGSVHA